MDAVYNVRPKTIAIALVGIATLLLIAHLSIWWFYTGPSEVVSFSLRHFFDLSREANIPTTFAAFLWLTSSLLLFMVWRSHKVDGRTQILWLLLSIIFAFLAIDELAHLHERLSRFIGNTWDLSGPLTYAWVLPYGIGTGVLSLFVVPLLKKIDREVRRWFIVAAAVFVTGAIGFEMIEGWHMDRMHGNGGNLIFFLVTTEEYIEMLGLTTFVYASLLFINKLGRDSPQANGKTKKEVTPAEADATSLERSLKVE